MMVTIFYSGALPALSVCGALSRQLYIKMSVNSPGCYFYPVSFFFYLGIMFAYFLVLPMVFKFFIYVAPASVEVRPDIGQYLSFIMRMFFAFGFLF